MTETPESTGQTQYGDRPDTPSRLGQVTAWTVIIAGVVFVVAAIFFSGFFLGWHSGGHYGWHRGYNGWRGGACPMMESDEMMESGGMMGPG
jgi:hypothetical protein